MDAYIAEKLIRKRFADFGGNDDITLNSTNSPELFSKFSNSDVPMLKSLNFGDEFQVVTRQGENNIKKLVIKKRNPHQL